MTSYLDRQNWDLDAWPEMYAKLKELQLMIFLSPPGLELNMMTFTISSLAAGCSHCQAHGAFGLDKAGLPMERIQALWSYETSDLFSDRERAALDLGRAAGVSPSGVTPEHHRALRDHFSDAEARTLIGVCALGGFMNRYNDTLATVTDAESRDWAETHLSGVGWSIDKHVGEAREQRSGPPKPGPPSPQNT
jgi:alkylhydroperoxidase family enzyme